MLQWQVLALLQWQVLALLQWQVLAFLMSRRRGVAGSLEEDRLAELYRSYGPVIYARCVNILGEGAAAEDATQETFLRVQRHLASAPDTAEALAWIYRIATNYCLNEVRNRRQRPELPGDLPELSDREGESVIANRDFARKLVAYAPMKSRTVAWLHHVDGMDQGTVARVLGVSRRTVVTRLAEFEDYARRFAKASGG
jgi:RNA polymerase sigma-70 factor (ECF subfamily)